VKRGVLLGLLFAGACAAGGHSHSPGVDRLLRLDAASWRSTESGRVHLHALAGSPAELRLDSLARRAESARQDDLALLGVSDYAPVLEILVLPDRDHMRRYTGETPGGWGIPAENTVLVVADGATGVPLRHELMHLLSWGLWGEPIGSWISEGVAMLPTPVCAGYTVEELTRAAEAEGRLVPLRELPRRFSAREAAHYAQAASVVRFVRDRYGIDGVRRLWVHGLKGTDAALGIPVDRLERDWREALARTPAREVDWSAIRRHGCEPT